MLLWTISSGKRLWLGSGEVADRGGWGFAARAERLWGPGISNGEKEAIGRWNHGLGLLLSEMWGKLRKYPHRFELGGSFSLGVSRAFRVSGFHRRWEFSRAL